MSAKHTPGPWSLKTYTYFSGGTAQGDVIDADGRTIRVCGVSLTSTPESQANARLIAAAPELLEALRTFADEYVAMINSGDCGFWNPEDEDKVKGARAAIAKATGGAA